MNLGQGLAPESAPGWVTELAGSLDQVGMQVNGENVLGAARVFLDEAVRLEDAGQWHGRQAVVRLCGDDPVSHDAAREYTARLQGIVDEGLLVAGMLRAAGERLLATARSYGHAEAEIQAVLRRAEVAP